MKRMASSKDAVDQRFINLFKVRKAYQRGIKVGFDGFENQKSFYSKHDDPFEDQIQQSQALVEGDPYIFKAKQRPYAKHNN